jgi:hypothetical protein
LSIYVKANCIECGGVDVDMGYYDNGICSKCTAWREARATQLENEYQHWHSKHKAQVPAVEIETVEPDMEMPDNA